MIREGEILALAIKIGQHWRDQEGVNGALLDQLAELTKSVPTAMQCDPKRCGRKGDISEIDVARACPQCGVTFDAKENR